MSDQTPRSVKERRVILLLLFWASDIAGCWLAWRISRWGGVGVYLVGNVFGYSERALKYPGEKA